MRKTIEDTLTIFFISTLYLLTYSTEGYPTIEPGKALNPQAITVNQPCHAKEIGNNTLLSYNVGTTLTLSDFIGVCLSWFLEKIACRREDSSLTKCVNESSTSPLCYSSTVDIYYKRSLDGNYTIFVSVPKEVIRKYSPVNVTAHFEGTSPDLTCYHNGPVSAGTTPTNSPSSFMKADSDADTPASINSTVATITNLKPDPDVDTTTNSTATPSLKPDPDAGTRTNSSTVTPSLKPHPDAGKLKVDQIVGIVFGVIAVALILGALFYIYYRYKKKEQEESYNHSNGSSKKGNQEIAMHL